MQNFCIDSLNSGFSSKIGGKPDFVLEAFAGLVKYLVCLCVASRFCKTRIAHTIFIIFIPFKVIGLVFIYFINKYFSNLSHIVMVVIDAMDKNMAKILAYSLEFKNIKWRHEIIIIFIINHVSPIDMMLVSISQCYYLLMYDCFTSICSFLFAFFHAQKYWKSFWRLKNAFIGDINTNEWRVLPNDDCISLVWLVLLLILGSSIDDVNTETTDGKQLHPLEAAGGYNL